MGDYPIHHIAYRRQQNPTLTYYTMSVPTQHHQDLSYADDKKQDVEMIEDKEFGDAAQTEANPVRVVETCFEGYTEEETKVMGRKLVRLIDFRVLPVLILLFLVSHAPRLHSVRHEADPGGPDVTAQHLGSKQHR
jgi:hypothetical protein